MSAVTRQTGAFVAGCGQPRTWEIGLRLSNGRGYGIVESSWTKDEPTPPNPDASSPAPGAMPLRQRRNRWDERSCMSVAAPAGRPGPSLSGARPFGRATAPPGFPSLLLNETPPGPGLQFQYLDFRRDWNLRAS